MTIISNICNVEHANHLDIRRYLKDLDTEQLQLLGLALGLYYPTVKGMKSLPDDLIHAWLLRQDDVIKRSGEPTYERLALALEEIGQNGIAQDVQKQKHAKVRPVQKSHVSGVN